MDSTGSDKEGSLTMDFYEKLSNCTEADMSKINAVNEKLQKIREDHFNDLSKDEREAIVKAELLLLELWSSKKTELERFAEAMEEDIANR